MPRHLGLIRNQAAEIEKRVFPRFPFASLTFRPLTVSAPKKGKNPLSVEMRTPIYEVLDISSTGMQLCLKDGKLPYKKEGQIFGELNWRGKKLSIVGLVQWTRENRLGVSFDFANNPQLKAEVEGFLHVSRCAETLRPLHQNSFGMELPGPLKYWLRTDGPVELFVWQHASGAFSSFQVIYREHFLEWVDGTGLKTGRVMSQRDVETPLNSEDEFTVQFDSTLAPERCGVINQFLDQIGEDLLPRDVLDFLIRKLHF